MVDHNLCFLATDAPILSRCFMTRLAPVMAHESNNDDDDDVIFSK
jgi:hypothetical protein